MVLSFSPRTVRVVPVGMETFAVTFATPMTMESMVDGPGIDVSIVETPAEATQLPLIQADRLAGPDRADDGLDGADEQGRRLARHLVAAVLADDQRRLRLLGEDALVGQP